MNNLLALLTQLAPLAATFAPGAGQISLIAVAVANLIAYIQQQSGMTTDQILERAGVTLDDNERMLLEDQIRLQDQ
jgi:hypothetical protein